MIKKSALFIIASGLLFSACTIPGFTSNSASTAPANVTNAPQTQNLLTISKYTFSPQILTVNANSTVTIANNDSVIHTVTSDDNGVSFNVTSVSAGSTATFISPSKPGTYTYHCSIHPSMTGTLVVQ